MKQTSNEIMKNLERIQCKDTYTLLHDFFIMSAISIRNSVDHRPNQYETHENRYKSIVKNYNGNELKIISESFAMLYKEYQQILNGDKPFCDLLGELYMSSNTSNGKAGQFFTPYCLSQMCAISAIDEEQCKAKIEADPHDVISVLEPSCGAGGMLVAAAERLQNIGVNYSYNSVMYGVDVDERCVAMSYIQCSLLGIPAVITHGDALTVQTWDEWETPAYIFNFMHFDKHRRSMDDIGKILQQRKERNENEPAQTIETNEGGQRKTDSAEKEKNPGTDSVVPPAVPTVFSVDKNGQLSLF